MKKFQNKKILLASISIGYYTDRNGKTYQDFVPPDKKIEFVLNEQINEDAGLSAAINWLRK